MFQDMMERIEDETIRYLFFLRIRGRRRSAGALSRTGRRRR